MIDCVHETLISLADVPAHLPARRGGKRPHVSCIYRWAQRGCRGVTLETIQVGGTKCTSLEALQRFFEALGGTNSPPSSPRTPRQRQQAIQRAEKELAEAGI